MKKPVLMAIFVLVVIIAGLAYFFYLGRSPGVENEAQDSLSEPGGDNPDFSENETQGCVSADCLKDNNYLNLAVASGNMTPCNNITDPALKKECRIAVLEGMGGGGSGGGGENKGGGKQSENNNLPQIIKVVDLISAYRCGSEICFQLKAYDFNTDVVDVRETMYQLNDAKKEAVVWDGGVNKPACILTSELEAGQTCFGKIPDSTCLLGDVFQASFSFSGVSWRVLGECE